MSDFAATYDRFLGLIDDDAVRGEVTEQLTKMAQSEARSPEYATAHRDLVRVLKSRAPQVLPQQWREDPRLEDVTRTYHHDDLRKDWKESMESDGVYTFGRLPTFEDIDKHYGKGDSRHYSKTHFSEPSQKVHGHELGTRHKVVRLAALPKYRNNIEGLAADMGLPQDTPYRELVSTKHESAANRVFDNEFSGKEVEAAVEGTGKAGENFKLSAGNARGARADEHQDPVVRETDAPARQAAARQVYADQGAEPSAAAGAKPSELLNQVGDKLDDTSKRIFTHAASLERFKNAGTVARAYQRGTERNKRRVETAQKRVSASGGDGGVMTEAFGEIADAMADQGYLTAGYELRLHNDPQLAAQMSEEDRTAVENVAQHSAALGAISRAINYAAQHQDNMRDAGDHPRVAGPDSSNETASFHVLPLPELLAAAGDLAERGPHEPRVTFQPGREQAAPAPAPVAPTPSRVSEPQRAEQPAAAPAKPRRLPVPEAAPAAGAKPARTKAEAGKEVDAEMKRRGLEFKGEGYKQSFFVDEMMSGDMSAADVFNALGPEGLAEITRPAGSKGNRIPVPEVPQAAPGRDTAEVKAPRVSEAERRVARSRDRGQEGTRVQPARPGAGIIPTATAPRKESESGTLAAALNMGGASSDVASRLNIWRDELASKIKDPDREMKALSDKLKGFDGEDKERRIQVIDALESFARQHDLEREGTTLFDTMRYKARPRSVSDPQGFERPRASNSKARGAGPKVAPGGAGSTAAKLRGMKKRLPVQPRRFPVGGTDADKNV